MRKRHRKLRVRAVVPLSCKTTFEPATISILSEYLGQYLAIPLIWEVICQPVQVTCMLAPLLTMDTGSPKESWIW